MEHNPPKSSAAREIERAVSTAHGKINVMKLIN